MSNATDEQRSRYLEFLPTAEVRWKESKNTRSHVLQQRWVNGEGVVEWRKVPSVLANAPDRLEPGL